MDFRVKVLTFTAESEGDVGGSAGRVGTKGIGHRASESRNAVVPKMCSFTAIEGHGQYFGTHDCCLVFAFDGKVS